MTTAQKIAMADRLRSAAIEAMDEVATLEELTTCLRLIQLMNQGAHPDDSIGWSTDGTTGSAMARLEVELQSNKGMDETCDQRARELLALIRLGQTTLRVIATGDDEWGGAIATAKQWAARPSQVFDGDGLSFDRDLALEATRHILIAMKLLLEVPTLGPSSSGSG